MGINWNRCFTCQLHELKNTTFCVWSWRNARAYNPGYNAHSTFRFDDVSHPGYGVYIIYGITKVSSDEQCTKQLGMKSFRCVDAFIHPRHATLHNIREHIFCLIPTSNDRKVYKVRQKKLARQWSNQRT